MKLIYQLCLTLFFASLLTSCGDLYQDDRYHEVIDESQLTASGVLSRMGTPVFFYMVEKDIITHEQKGWIVDVYGKVLTYDMTNLGDIPNLPKGSSCSFAQIETLVNLATTKQVALEMNTLLSKVQNIKFAAKVLLQHL